ncbi:MAG TPA: hypothetical protein PKO47_14580, partial [bacterium]|nr:hypothetical protein [bacterium]
MRLRLFIVMTFFLLARLFGQDRIGVPKFHFYSPKEYNGGTQIWSITQDRDGIMYFASGGHNA